MRQRAGLSLFVALAAALAAVILPSALAPPVACAHGGPPLRVAVPGDPALAAIGRLALVHLREGVGFAVVWQEHADEAAVRAALAAGKADIAVAFPQPADLPAAAPGAVCAPADLERVREALRARWGAEVFLLGFAPGPDPCRRPALLVARGVLEDLRFGILGREAARLAAAVSAADVDAVLRAAAGGGGERSAVAAARAALAAKGLR